MSADAVCPFCNHRQLVRADGKFRVHSRYPMGDTIVCEGVGESPDDERLARRAPLYLAADKARRLHARTMASLAAARDTIAQLEPQIPRLTEERDAANEALKAFDTREVQS